MLVKRLLRRGKGDGDDDLDLAVSAHSSQWTYLGRKLEDVSLDAPQNVGFDHVVKLMNQRLCQVLKAHLKLFKVSKALWVEEVEKVEELAQVVVQRCARQEYAVNRVEGLEAVEDQIGVRFHCKAVSCGFSKVSILTALALVHDDHLPARHSTKDGKLAAGDHVVRSEDDMASVCKL